VKSICGLCRFKPRIPSLQQCVASFLCARRLCTSTNVSHHHSRTVLRRFRTTIISVGPRVVRSVTKSPVELSLPVSLGLHYERTCHQFPHAGFLDAYFGANHLWVHHLNHMAASHEHCRRKVVAAQTFHHLLVFLCPITKITNAT
jgi:hypothetical protein